MLQNTQTKERPIIFNGAMVRAILSGQKTQTRRIMKPQPAPRPDKPGEYWWPAKAFETMVNMSDFQRVGFEGATADASPFGRIGDRLWVRETFGDCGVRRVYRADTDDGAACQVKRWTPSIHMPRGAARITLEIIDVRVERLNSISEGDADAEGCERLDFERDERDWSLCPKCGGTRLHDALGANYGVIHDVDCQQCNTYAKRFMHLWQYIYGEESWSANPWVWVVEFRVIEGGAA